MKNKNGTDKLYLDNEGIKNNNFHLAKSDDDLFHEEDHILHSVIRAKRINSPRKGEHWQLLQDGEEVLFLAGNRFGKKEKEFLYTPEGMSFLVSSYKSGLTSVVKIKQALKKIMKIQ
jgi:hypothetical protein